MVIEIKLLTLAIGGILILFAMVTPLCSPFFRRPHKGGRNQLPESSPKFSIVIPIQDNVKELEENLLQILAQEYEPGFEVILVNESPADDTDEVLKRLKQNYPHLYTTYIPDTSHYLSRRKLALTVGVKAAHNDWIIFTSIHSQPVSTKWLQALSQYCGKDTTMVLGHTVYDSEEVKDSIRFERLMTDCYIFRKAERGIAWRYQGENLAFRKSLFMENNGFLKNLKFLRGEYDFIVNEYAENGRTEVMLDEEGTMIEQLPSNKAWTEKRLYYMETRRHLKRSVPMRLLFDIDNLMLHLNYWLEIAAIVYASLTDDWILLGISIFSLLVTLTMRIAIASRTIHSLYEQISLWKIPVLEIRVVWQNAMFWIRHLCSSRYDFIRR